MSSTYEVSWQFEEIHQGSASDIFQPLVDQSDTFEGTHCDCPCFHGYPLHGIWRYSAWKPWADPSSSLSNSRIISFGSPIGKSIFSEKKESDTLILFLFADN